ncbi:pentatricopeptide repeat-containing protein At1g62930, chloroplastic-like [Hibiscus syriacus]|uniref:pentatricopeptide repeat-containing protein At1g62930, chloroplastic-like n=1 Tax=Hibiscus syriacus TaxID=106335 RepID=UPI00192100EC|nr:pentatricopeptide repeat-containing protein At1g62930, chloroplastic-like [Hibiscus syriacus]
MFSASSVSKYLTGDDNTFPAPECKEVPGDLNGSFKQPKSFGKSMILQEYSLSKTKAIIEILQSKFLLKISVILLLLINMSIWVCLNPPMISLRPFPSIVAFNHLLGAVSKMKHYELVVSMCKQMMDFDVVAINIWLRFLCNLKKVILGFSVLAMTIKLGLQPDHYTMNSLLWLIDEGKIAEPTYGFIIRGLCNSGNIRFAVVLLIKMNVNGSFEPNVICYNTIIDGFCKEKQMDKAFIIFQDMFDRRIEPNVVTFSSLMDFAVLIQEAISLFDLMTQKGIEPNVATYNMLIRALCKFGEWRLTTKFFENMIGSEISPDAVTFNSMIDCLCKEGKSSKASEILELMTRKGKENRRSHTMLELMCQRNVKSDAITYNSLIHGFCYSGKWEEATSLLHRMMNERVDPDVATFNSFINALCGEKRTKEANTMLELLCQRNVKPEVVTYNSLIHGFCHSGKWEEAMSLLDRMMNEGVHPDVVTFSSLSMFMQGKED